MLPQQIVRILNFFDIFGLNSGSSDLTINLKVAYFIHFVHILIAFLCVLFQFWMSIIYFRSEFIGLKITLFLQYISALYAYWLIIFESLLHHRVHKHFWQIFQRINEHFHSQVGFYFKIYATTFFEFFIVTIALVIASFVENGIERLGMVLVFLFLIKVCQLKVFYYIFCVKIVTEQLEIIEIEVTELKNILNRRFDENVLQINRFVWIRKYFECVYEMTECLNKVFGWSQVAAILFCYYLLLTDLAWSYLTFSSMECTTKISK